MTKLEIIISCIFIFSFLRVHFQLLQKQESQLSVTTNTELSRMYFLDGLAFIIILIGYYFPSSFYILMLEDGTAEWVTFYSFAISGCIVLLYLLGLSKAGQRVFSFSFFIPLAVVLFCLVVAGEEISWGQRLLAFKPPNVFLEHNYQQELNVHNLFKKDGLWGIAIESKQMVMLVALVFGVLFPLITRFIPQCKQMEKHAPALFLMPFFLLVIVMEKFYPIKLTGEACEMYLGFIFLIHTFDTYGGDKVTIPKVNQKHTFFALFVLIFIVGLITAPVLKLFIFKSATDAETKILKELTILKKDFLNPMVDKEVFLNTRKVHVRVYRIIQEDIFQLPESSLFGKGETGPNDFFIDPWSNSYWIYYHRKEQKVVFYSFGPNRKRDSNFDKDLTIQGDDIGVVFRVK